MNEIEQLKKRIKDLEDKMNFFVMPDRYLFKRDIELFNGQNIRVGKSIGSSFGKSSTDKASVYGVTPVIQASAISSPSGGTTIDSQARTAIDSIRNAIKNFGITA